MRKIYVICIELCMKWGHLPALKGNNCCKTYNFRIKVGYVQWSIIFVKFISCRYFTYSCMLTFKNNIATRSFLHRSSWTCHEKSKRDTRNVDVHPAFTNWSLTLLCFCKANTHGLKMFWKVMEFFNYMSMFMNNMRETIELQSQI